MLVDAHEDVSINEADDRWLLTYQVPATYTHDGSYCVSMPKNMLTDFAATYGYDLDDPADVEEMWDHLIHLPMLRETARLDGRVHETAASPYEMSAQAARQLARDQVAGLKKAWRITERRNVVPAAGRLARAVGEGGSLLDGIKRDMLARASAAHVRDLAEAKEAARSQVQDRMIRLALRMNASHSE